MPQSRLGSSLLLVVLLLLAFLILMLGVAAMHMQPDETLTYVTTHRGFFEAIRFTLTEDVHAPLWFMLAWVWQQFAGLSEFAGRYQSVLISLLTLCMVYRIGRDNFKQPVFGAFALLLLSSNAFFLIYTLEIRPYPLVMLTATISYRFFLAWLRSQRMTSALFYGLSLCLMLYTHYYLAFVILSQAIYFLLFKIWNKRLFLQGLAAALLASLLLMPQFIALSQQLQIVRFTQGGTQGVPTSASNSETLINLLNLASNGWIILLLAIVLLGLLRLWRSPAYQASLFWFFVAPGLLILANLWTPLLTSRYISYAAPALSLLVGFAIAAYWRNTLKWQSALWLLVLFLAGLNLLNIASFFPQRVPYRLLFGEVSEEFQSGDVMVINETLYSFDFMEDQFSRYLPPELLANRTNSLEEARNTRRIWYFTDTISGESYQNSFRSLETSHRVLRVLGDCTRQWCYIVQLMLAPPMPEPIFFGESIGFLGADIEAIENGQLPVLLWWMVEESPDADYSIALQLLNTDGSLATQLDRQIDPPEAEIGEIPTSQLQAGSNYTDLRILDISALPEGDYRLQLVVYRWQDGSRLSLPDGSDAHFIQTIHLD